MRRAAQGLALALLLTACDSADVPTPDAGRDARPSDAGLDSGAAPIDAGPELDAALDAVAALDAGLDAATDAGMDAARDAGVDAGRDTGADAATTCTGSTLYFGSPSAFTVVDAPFQQAHLTPDGLRLLTGPNIDPTLDCCMHEYTRRSLDSAFGRARVDHGVGYPDAPHPLGAGLTTFACHLGALGCALLGRPTLSDTFGTVVYRYVGESGIHDPLWGDAARSMNLDLTPTPDVRFIAFRSNRTSPTDPTPDPAHPSDLWTAEAIDPAHPEMDFQHLERIGSGITGQPEWFSDDGLTLVFTAVGTSSRDVFVLRRSAIGAAWGAPDRIDALSDDVADEDSFTVPSVETIRAHGCRADGFLRRSTSVLTHEWLAFLVCLVPDC